MIIFFLLLKKICFIFSIKKICFIYKICINFENIKNHRLFYSFVAERIYSSKNSNIFYSNNSRQNRILVYKYNKTLKWNIFEDYDL